MRRTTLLRSIKRQTNSWLIVSLLGAALTLLPLLPILLTLFHAPNENWQHIKEFLLKDYILNSLYLMAAVGALTVSLGLSLAWLIAAYDFPGRSFFRWALLLPLALPPYIAAYTYTNMFSYTGVVQRSLRAIGLQPDAKWFGIMSMRGAIFVLTLCLFPYVYLITRSFLERQSSGFIESAMLLGRRGSALFFQVILPLARPAIIGGLILVLFEVLSDYGVTSYYGIPTISTAIFQTWFGMYDVDSALRLAAWLMVVIMGLFIFERVLQKNRRFTSSAGRARPLAPRLLEGPHGWIAAAFCGLIFAWSFLIPVLQLGVWATWTYETVLTPAFLMLTLRSLLVALLSTAIILVIAVIVANVQRTYATPFTNGLARLVTAGYSLPGAIIGMGVLAAFIALDQLLAPLYARLGLGKAPLILSMSIVMLVVAYVVRFMATGFNAIEAGFAKVGSKYMEAARTLGYGMTTTFFKVDLPMIKGALLSGALLTLVEIVKELPLALLLRPFNFETLATRAYQFANDEKIHEASVPSLFIVALAMLAIILLNRVGKESKE